VTVKAGEVVDVAMLAHGSLLSVRAGACFYHAAANAGNRRRRHHLVTNGWFLRH
jgi:hypothetical protein